jgi:hypothetical protein
MDLEALSNRCEPHASVERVRRRAMLAGQELDLEAALCAASS